MKPLKTLALVWMTAAFGFTAFGFTAGTAYGDDGVRVRGAISLDFGCGTVEYRTPGCDRVVVVEQPVIICKKHHRHVPYRDHGWGPHGWFEKDRHGRTVIVMDHDGRRDDNGRWDDKGRKGRDNGKNGYNRDGRDKRDNRAGRDDGNGRRR